MKLVSALGLSAAALIASTSLATAALDYSRESYHVAGKHQIYVWCTSGSADQSVQVDAANGADAIVKAVAGKANCWGAWQGLVK